MLEELRRLGAHMDWADQRALAALRASGGEPARALELYAHILGAEEVWLSRLERRRATVAVWPALTLDECGELAGANRTRFDAFVRGLSENDLRGAVPYVNSAGQSFDSMVGDILLHVMMHGSYHRGQVMLLLREAGKEPQATDYIAFVRGAPAATRR
jgi:uncharacterized damage-inducible protein DinB